MQDELFWNARPDAHSQQTELVQHREALLKTARFCADIGHAHRLVARQLGQRVPGGAQHRGAAGRSAWLPWTESHRLSPAGLAFLRHLPTATADSCPH